MVFSVFFIDNRQSYHSVLNSIIQQTTSGIKSL